MAEIITYKLLQHAPHVRNKFWSTRFVVRCWNPHLATASTNSLNEEQFMYRTRSKSR